MSFFCSSGPVLCVFYCGEIPIVTEVFYEDDLSRKVKTMNQLIKIMSSTENHTASLRIVLISLKIKVVHLFCSMIQGNLFRMHVTFKHTFQRVFLKIVQ